MENVVLYSGHLEYFTTIGYILWAFGSFVVIWYIFSSLWYIYQEKSGNPGPKHMKKVEQQRITLHF
jgi:hypothetical protein